MEQDREQSFTHNQEERHQAGSVNIIRKGVNKVVKLSDGYHLDNMFRRLSPKQKMLYYIRRGSLDLHLHSNASDGFDSPPQLLEKVMEKRLLAFAVTDHDTIWGVQDCEIILEKLRLMRVPVPDFVPGVELSVDFEEQEIHLLGYFPSGGIEKIRPYLLASKERRNERNQKLCERLTELGFPITIEELNRQGGQVINRVHAAILMMRKGYADTVNEAFDKYLGAGRPAFVAYEHPSAEEALKLIQTSGGISVLAHPVLYGWEESGKTREKLERLKKLGLQGLEVVHGETDMAFSKRMSAVAKELDLLRSIGSDYHGLNKKGVHIFDPKEDYSDYLHGHLDEATIRAFSRTDSPDF